MPLKVKLQIKPLSVNECWQGKRFKTKAYLSYEKQLLLLLPKIGNSDFSRISIEFGFSSKLSDLDNPIKPLLDVLQKKYAFNDKDIYELNIKKTDVKKGEEFILINID